MSTQRSEPTSHARHEATRQRRITRRRQKEVKEDITYLNITPMLDMMTILLVFLLKSFSASAENVTVENLTLPSSVSKLNVKEALQLMVTENAILVDQKIVTRLAPDGNVSAGDLPEGPDGYLIRPLYDALEGRASYFKRIEEFGGSRFDGRIAIIADRKTSYRTLFRILYTVGRAEFGLFRLFVQKLDA
ncbi:MAG: biopolymer transporter ExbD [Myxococcota bacterium]